MRSVAKYPGLVGFQSASGVVSWSRTARVSTTVTVPEEPWPARGNPYTMPVATTPGNLETRSTACRKNSRSCSGLGYRASGSQMRMVNTFSGRKPGSTCIKRRKLFSSSPAPASSTSDKAISATTSERRSANDDLPAVEPRPPSLRDSCETLDICKLGAMPKSTPVPMEISVVKASTQPSRCAPARRGKLAAAMVVRTRTPHRAITSPATPPASAKATLLVRSWRTSRRRSAPKAVRIAISRSRAEERASRRLATLAQAIKSTRPTAPIRIHRAVWRSPTISSSSGVTIQVNSNCLYG